MQIFTEITTLQSELEKYRLKDLKVGLVPTMGALHNGHATLIKSAVQETDISVCTIFVNPIQFDNSSDLENYPSTLDDDIKILESLGCDLLFLPSAKEMYPAEPTILFNFGELENAMEGAFRKGHFNGVGIVVTKFFNIVKPNKAYFGQKDLQQFLIIEALVRDLNIDIELVCVPIVREESGLAISSRNQRLSAKEKEIACQIYSALELGRELLLSGRDISAAKREIHNFLGKWQEICPEYVEVVNRTTLKPKERIDANDEVAICIAAYLGKVRLIDNLIFKK